MAPSSVRMESTECRGGTQGSCGGRGQCAYSMSVEGETAAESARSGRSQSELRAWGASSPWEQTATVRPCCA